MKKKIIFTGVGTALITPFRDGEIDFFAMGELIDRQIAGGIGALIVGGTTGEVATLSDKERYRIYEFAKERTAGRAKLILGTGTNDTAAATRHTKVAASLGCDGALLVTPYYNKGTEEGIYRHYGTIAEAVELPIILYNVPSRTGVNLGINLLRRLSSFENIVGIKEASDSTDRLVELSGLSESLSLYAGNDSQIFPTLALGGLGVISVVSNILPQGTAQICESFFAGDLPLSRGIQLELLPLIKALFSETNPAPVKYAASRLGLCKNELRLPLYRVREDTEERIDKAMKELSEQNYSF